MIHLISNTLSNHFLWEMHWIPSPIKAGFTGASILQKIIDALASDERILVRIHVAKHMWSWMCPTYLGQSACPLWIGSCRKCDALHFAHHPALLDCSLCQNQLLIFSSIRVGRLFFAYLDGRKEILRFGRLLRVIWAVNFFITRQFGGIWIAHLWWYTHTKDKGIQFSRSLLSTKRAN